MITKVINVNLHQPIYEKLTAKQGDIASRYLLFHLLDGDKPFDLSNKTVRVYAIKPDKTEIFNDLTINDARKGYCTLELTSQCLASAGVVKMELYISESGKVLTSIPFELEVIKCINTTDSIISTNEFSALNEALGSLQDYNNLKSEVIQARKTYVNVGARLNDFDWQLDNIENEKATKQEVDVERKRIDSFTSLDEGSTTGDAELIDGRTGADGVVYSNIGNAIRTQVTNTNNDISDLDIFKRYNLATSLESGMYRNGSVVSVAGTYHTNKIFLRKGKKVYANNTIGIYGTNREAYKITDSGYSVLNRNTEDISDNYCRYDIQEDGYYIFNVIANGCVAYSKYNLSKYVMGCFMPDDVRNISVLYGKSISWIGDSIMEGYGYGGGFAKMIATKYNMTYQNLGHSGATVASGQKFADGINDRYCISLNIPNMTKSDYHIFEGGINDYSLSVPLGTFDKTNYNPTLDTTTFAGAFEKACMNMVDNFHDKKYGYIFVHRIATLTDKFEEYKNIAIQILKKWGIPYCDLDTLVPPLNLVTTLKQTYTANADGWHPNELGYKLFYVPKVIAFLESL